MDSSIHFNSCVDPSNQHPNWNSKLFHNPQNSLVLSLCIMPLIPGYPILTTDNHWCHINGIIQRVTFSDWFFFFTQQMLLKFIQAVAYVNNSFILLLSSSPLINSTIIYLITSERHLGYFLFWTIFNRTVINIYVQVFLWTQVFISPG